MADVGKEDLAERNLEERMVCMDSSDHFLTLGQGPCRKDNSENDDLKYFYVIAFTHSSLESHLHPSRNA